MKYPTKGYNHRSFVGPEQLYDEVGQLQFQVLLDQGLQPSHTLLDIGCGSLRGGKHFILYLGPGKYFGVDPYPDLVREGIDLELTRGIEADKRPTFAYNSNFDFEFKYSVLLEWPLKPFDYVLAQSIFTHTTRVQATKLMESVSKAMHPDSKFVATYLDAQNSDGDDPDEWQYPGAVYFPRLFMKHTAQFFNLDMETLNQDHPTGQTWAVFTRRQ